jgi:hypothetical protein
MQLHLQNAGTISAMARSNLWGYTLEGEMYNMSKIFNSAAEPPLETGIHVSVYIPALSYN